MVGNNRNSRCARCNSTPSQNANAPLLRKLQQVGLALVETALYLDAYPENRAALAYYNKLLEERKRLSDALGENDRPMTALDAGKNDTWNWINSPWPWDIEAN